MHMQYVYVDMYISPYTLSTNTDVRIHVDIRIHVRKRARARVVRRHPTYATEMCTYPPIHIYST